jgi:hypothetical protein
MARVQNAWRRWTSLVSKRSDRFISGKDRRTCGSSRKLGLEPLEERALLSLTLVVDHVPTSTIVVALCWSSEIA